MLSRIHVFLIRSHLLGLHCLAGNKESRDQSISSRSLRCLFISLAPPCSFVTSGPVFLLIAQPLFNFCNSRFISRILTNVVANLDCRSSRRRCYFDYYVQRYRLLTARVLYEVIYLGISKYISTAAAFLLVKKVPTPKVG